MTILKNVWRVTGLGHLSLETGAGSYDVVAVCGVSIYQLPVIREKDFPKIRIPFADAVFTGEVRADEALCLLCLKDLRLA